MAQPQYKPIQTTFSADPENAYTQAQIMSKGFSGFRDALKDFQAGRTTAQSNAFVQGIMKYTDPAKLDADMNSGAAFAGVNPRDLTPEALTFAAKRRDDLQNYIRTGVLIEGDKLTNIRTGVLTQGDRLNNVNQSLVNSHLAWTNKRDEDFEAARPAAIKILMQAKALAATGNAGDYARANSFLTNDQNSAALAAAGISVDDADKIMKGQQPLATSGQELNRVWKEASLAETKEDRKRMGEEFGKVAAKQGGNLATATEMLKKSGLDPELIQYGITFYKDHPDIFPDPQDLRTTTTDMKTRLEAGGGTSDSRAGASNAIANAADGNAIVYANQGATRALPLNPTLTSIMNPIAVNHGVTMKVFSGGQVSNKPGEGTGSTRHNDGNAGDVEFYDINDGHKLDPRNPSDQVRLSSIAREGMVAGVGGWGEGGDYMGHGRIHLGFGTPAIWGAGGKGANAPEWLRAVFGEVGGQVPARPTGASGPQGEAQRLADGFAPQATPIGTTGSDTMSAILKQAQYKKADLTADEVTALDQGVTDLGTDQQLLSNQIDADLMFNPDLRMLKELKDRPNVNKDKAALAEDIFKTLNGQTPDDATKNEIIQELDQVIKETGLSKDLAASFMKDYVYRHAYGSRWLFGETDIDTDAVKQKVDEYLNPDGSVQGAQLAGAGEKLRELDVKAAIKQEMQALAGEVQVKEDAYQQALAAKQSNPSIDIKRPLSQYAAAIAAYKKVIDKAKENPLTDRSSSRAIPQQ